jgi:hypothetical protein
MIELRKCLENYNSLVLKQEFGKSVILSVKSDSRLRANVLSKVELIQSEFDEEVILLFLFSGLTAR